ncbi:DUF2182 domain-containing protein [Yoonia sediminilitoris]|uniref:Putative metal-binding membrane protein n=1 Tax=Yoonia sediminilitoris TaxID=1286148 RepID=A0A2T6K970_9RHOB|nr:DUF2182 domain-containing protein [Yoonia sediminilitoris]PUB11304.1 putative metal-binding membrane protein [Yoonia sediminilitoris]RCW91120.1 putative metal-binding membrane protein [Yoonia sediminilitoris]
MTSALQRFPLRTVLWLAFFGVIAAAWTVMFMMAKMSGVDFIGQPVSGNMMPMQSFGALFPMWAIMMAAMMLPTMVPTLTNYERLMVSADGTRAGWVGVLAGYFLVWVAFAAGISLMQIGLLHLHLIDGLGIATSRHFAATLLILVGTFQFTRAKDVCHGVCHAPMTYFLGDWRTGFVGGLRMGVGLGAFCVGCCWGFMALGFVGGVMSLLWMGLATLLMIFEKLPAVGHYAIKPTGGLLIAGGLAVLVF